MYGKGYGAPEGKGWGAPPGRYGADPRGDPWYGADPRGDPRGDPRYGGGGYPGDHMMHGKGFHKGEMYGRPGPYDDRGRPGPYDDRGPPTVEGGCRRRTGGSAPATGRVNEDSDKEFLIQRVKRIQREASGGREAWEKYVDALRTGNRDPSKHTVQALSNFCEAVEQGERPEIRAAKTLGDGRVLRLRGVPFQAGTSDVVDFLAEYDVDKANVTLGVGADGKRTGEAFAVFESADLAVRALEERQRKEIGGRYIELFRATHQEREEAASHAEVGGSSGNPDKDDLVVKVKFIQKTDPDGKEKWYKFCDSSRTGIRDPGRHSMESLRVFLHSYETGESVEAAGRKNASNVLRLRGVPYQSTIPDVVAFLEEYEVLDSHVTFGYGADGRRTGEAYAEFSSVQVAERALNEKQKQEIHGRYIELFRSSAEERTMETKVGRNAPSQPGSSVSKEDRMKEDLVNRVKGAQRSSQDGKAQWEKFCELSRTGIKDPTKLSASFLSQFLECFDRGEMPTEAPNKESRVLRLRGVPYQSDILDVVQFLSDYGLENSDVVLGCNADGRATGEAFVTFLNSEDAEEALEKMQKKEIRGRYIELFRCDMEERDEAARVRGELAVVDSPMSAGGGEGEKDDLVARVKGIQRSSQEGREQWEKFCGIMRTGNRDPIKHTATSMRYFLECYAKGEMPSGPPEEDSLVLRLRGVPFQSNVSDIVEFLKEYDIDKSKVAFGTGPGGKPSGESIVVFPSAEMADRALEEKQKQEIRGRYIELFRSNQEEFEEATRTTQQAMASALEGGSGVNEKDDLVNRVKSIQRISGDGKAAWQKYCDVLKTGSHDPSRHTPESMRNFVEAFEQGEAPETAAEKLSGGGRVLRLRGVPFQSGLADVVKFLEEYEVEASQVAVGREKGGRATGEAFAIFPTSEGADRAMEEMQRKEIRGRWIELFRSSTEDFNQAVALGGQKDGSDSGSGSFEDLVMRVKQIQRSDAGGKDIWYEYCDQTGIGSRDPLRHTTESLKAYLEAYDKGEKPTAPTVVGDGRVLRLRGVPFQSTATDVVAFLLEYDIDKSHVSLTTGSAAKHGEAYVVFPSAELADHALKEKHRQEMHGRYIELFRSSIEERDRVMNTSSTEPAARGGSAANAFNHLQRPPSLPPNAPTLVLRGLPFQAKVKDVVDFLSSHDVHAAQVVAPTTRDGKSSGEALVAFPTVDAAEEVFKSKQKQSMGSRYIELFRTTFEKWLDAGGDPRIIDDGFRRHDMGGYGPKGGCGGLRDDFGPYGKGYDYDPYGPSKGSGYGSDFGFEGKGAPHGGSRRVGNGEPYIPKPREARAGNGEPYIPKPRVPMGGKGAMKGPGGDDWGCGKGHEGYGKGYEDRHDAGKGWGMEGGGRPLSCGAYGKGGDPGYGGDFGKGPDYGRGACFGDYGKGADYKGGDYGKGPDPYRRRMADDRGRW